jgi:hypothetical protein
MLADIFLFLGIVAMVIAFYLAMEEIVDDMIR